MSVTDPEILNFIAQTQSFYPPEANMASVEENRRLYDAMSAHFRAERPQGLDVFDERIAGRPVRRYCPKGVGSFGSEIDEDAATLPFALFAHGGGFVVGSLDSHDDVCAELAYESGVEIVSVDYRLSPEHLFPAALDDVSDVWQALTINRDRTGLVIGDSAGGNLVAALCLRARERNWIRPNGQILIYPGLGWDMDLPSRHHHANAPMLSSADIAHYLSIYIGSKDLAHHQEVSPLSAKDLSDLPEAFIVSADIDPLRDDGQYYAQRLREAGVKAIWRNEEQLVHGYLRARHQSWRARDSFSAICQALSRMAYED
ncbi:MAG: alpha/beta hydrolase [Cohaesibacter sp.]|nr:alpha/beta hydrolase [Cohaesibacter sp.]